MALAENGLPLGLSKTELAGYGLKRIREESGDNTPTMADIRLFRPEHSAFDPKDPHSDPHIARAQILAARLVRTRFAGDPNLPSIERCVLTAFKWHDVRQGRKKTNGSHPLEAAAAFATQPVTNQFTKDERHLIIGLIYYHSGLIDPPEPQEGSPFLGILRLFKDADASDLGRLTLTYPVRYEDIRLCTEEAKRFYLPLVAQRIELVSRLMGTDPYEAQLQAAQFLGLLR